MGEDELIHILTPQKVEMLKVWDLGSHGVGWKLLKHDIDVDERITASIHQGNRCCDVPGWKFCYLIETPVGKGRSDSSLNVIVVHLEALIANDLEPMDNTCTQSVNTQKQDVRSKNILFTDV